jgi:hypothetical protein
VVSFRKRVHNPATLFLEEYTEEEQESVDRTENIQNSISGFRHILFNAERELLAANPLAKLAVRDADNDHKVLKKLGGMIETLQEYD